MGDLPIIAQGSNIGALDDYDPNCGDQDGEDVSFAWTVPEDGLYRIDTHASAYDTVLAVVPGFCNNAMELACIDDTVSDLTSEISLNLQAGTELTIHLDAFDDTEAGNYVLEINKLMCPAVTEVSNVVPVQELGTVMAGPSELEGSCGGAGPERVFFFTAPWEGSFLIDTYGSTYDTVLHVYSGSCEGLELGCNDDAMDLQSEVIVDLVATQTVYIVLDALDDNVGDFVLNISEF
jgi:hypothetical protein